MSAWSDCYLPHRLWGQIEVMIERRYAKQQTGQQQRDSVAANNNNNYDYIKYEYIQTS